MYDKYLERNQIKEMSFSNVRLYQTMKSNKMSKLQSIPGLSPARVTLNCTKVQISNRETFRTHQSVCPLKLLGGQNID